MRNYTRFVRNWPLISDGFESFDRSILYLEPLHHPFALMDFKDRLKSQLRVADRTEAMTAAHL